MTRNGIEYDFDKTPYQATINDSGEILIFYFSSKLNLDKFTERAASYALQTNDMLSRKFKIKLHFSTLPYLGLYKQIEKRGFKVFASRYNKYFHQDDTFWL